MDNWKIPSATDLTAHPGSARPLHQVPSQSELFYDFIRSVNTNRICLGVFVCIFSGFFCFGFVFLEEKKKSTF